jgi:hypothetical protein
MVVTYVSTGPMPVVSALFRIMWLASRLFASSACPDGCLTRCLLAWSTWPIRWRRRRRGGAACRMVPGRYCTADPDENVSSFVAGTVQCSQPNQQAAEVPQGGPCSADRCFMQGARCGSGFWMPTLPPHNPAAIRACMDMHKPRIHGLLRKAQQPWRSYLEAMPAIPPLQRLFPSQSLHLDPEPSLSGHPRPLDALVPWTP